MTGPLTGEIRSYNLVQRNYGMNKEAASAFAEQCVSIHTLTDHILVSLQEFNLEKKNLTVDGEVSSQYNTNDIHLNLFLYIVFLCC